MLSREAHECASAIPDLNNMVSGVQALGTFVSYVFSQTPADSFLMKMSSFAVAQCEDLKVKYGEEQAKRRKLYNQLQETKGVLTILCKCNIRLV